MKISCFLFRHFSLRFILFIKILSFANNLVFLWVFIRMKGKAFVLCVVVVFFFSGNNENNTSEKLWKEILLLSQERKWSRKAEFVMVCCFSSERTTFPPCYTDLPLPLSLEHAKKRFSATDIAEDGRNGGEDARQRAEKKFLPRNANIEKH